MHLEFRSKRERGRATVRILRERGGTVMCRVAVCISLFADMTAISFCFFFFIHFI